MCLGVVHPSSHLLSSPVEHLTVRLLTCVAQVALSSRYTCYSKQSISTSADLSIRNRHPPYSLDSYGLALGDGQNFPVCLLSQFSVPFTTDTQQSRDTTHRNCRNLQGLPVAMQATFNFHKT